MSPVSLEPAAEAPLWTAGCLARSGPARPVLYLLFVMSSPHLSPGVALEFAHQAACKIVCASGNTLTHTHTHTQARTRREALKFFLEQFQGFIYEIPRGVGETEVWTLQTECWACHLINITSGSGVLLLSVCCEPGPGWVGAGSMHRCPVLKAAGMPCPPFPQEGKTSMILTYFDRGPCLCSIFHHPLFPHFLALFLPEPAASLPLVHFPVESVCPVVGHLSPLKTGFVAGFSTGEKLGAACREFPSPHHSSLIPGSLAGSRHRHGRVFQLLEKTGVSRPPRMASKLFPLDRPWEFQRATGWRQMVRLIELGREP